jgi:hypothetical protein
MIYERFVYVIGFLYLRYFSVCKSYEYLKYYNFSIII